MKKIAKYSLTNEFLEIIIKSNDIDPFSFQKYSLNENMQCVYFLYQKEKLVYIGKTKDLLSRLSYHKKNKIFDSYSFLKCETNEIDVIERILINKFLPFYNVDSLTKKIKENE